MNLLANATRNPGDPKLIHAGPSVMPIADRVGRGLGWFSLALGALELARPALITRTLGLRGREGIVRAFGAREIMAGIMSLSVTRSAGLWARVAGDALDVAAVLSADDPRNPHRPAVRATIAALLAIGLVDILAAEAVTRVHARPSRIARDYRDRSGFPNGVAHARGAALKQRQPTAA